MGHRGPRFDKDLERMERAAEVPQHLKDKDPFLNRALVEKFVSPDGKYGIQATGKVGMQEFYNLEDRESGETLLTFIYDDTTRTLSNILDNREGASADPALQESIQAIRELFNPGPHQGQIEFVSSDERYHLVKHMNAVQLDEVGEFMTNCLRFHRLKHREFLDRMQKGEIEVFTLQDKNHVPVAAIEFDVAKRKIVQVMGDENSHPVLRSNYLGALFEAVEFLSTGTAYDMRGESYERGAKDFGGLDLTGLETHIRTMKPYGGLITKTGYVDAKDALELGVKEAYLGVVLVRPEMPEADVRQYAHIEGVTLDMTEATDAQRAILTNVKSDILDGSIEGRLTYPALLHARSITIPQRIVHAEFPVLTSVNRIVTHSELLSVPSLRQVKSIRLKVGDARVRGPGTVLTGGVVRYG